MKKFLSLLCCLSFISLLNSCGHKDSNNVTETEEEIIDMTLNPYTKKGADGKYYHRDDILAPKERTSTSGRKQNQYERGYEEGYEDAKQEYGIK